MVFSSGSAAGGGLAHLGDPGGFYKRLAWPTGPDSWAKLRPAMLYRLAADATLVLHLAFIAFVCAGALLCLRWRWMPMVHLPCAAWGVHVELAGRACPLTHVENHFRRLAGESGYGGGFVEHHLLPVIYPGGLTLELQYLLAGAVVGINVALYGWLVRRQTWRRARM